VKHIDEFRDPQAAHRLLDRIRKTATERWVVMDVCGGQTHGLVKSGIEQQLEGVIELVHGPGCPVCVTPAEAIDFAIEVSRCPETTVATFGDMMRVPGTSASLLQARSQGGSVQIVYSPIDVIKLAQSNPAQQFVFFAVGFETTAPATALAVLQAAALGLDNFSLLVSHVCVQPAMEAVLRMPDNRVQAFLAAGHVATITGYEGLEQITSDFRVPVVVTGFEPIDLLMGILECTRQLQANRPSLSNQYGRSVNRQGSPFALSMIDRVFEVVTRPWRGLGLIPNGGLRLREPFARFDAESRFRFDAPKPPAELHQCRAADVMSGKIKPMQCVSFGTCCTPLAPLGAPMVSSEGACAAYYRVQKTDASIQR
jgi:hydrogenase expression/formation protein HypD